MPAKSAPKRQAYSADGAVLQKRNRFGRKRTVPSKPTVGSGAQRYDALPIATSFDNSKSRVPPSYAEAQQLPVVTGSFIKSNDLKPKSLA